MTFENIYYACKLQYTSAALCLACCNLSFSTLEIYLTQIVCSTIYSSVVVDKSLEEPCIKMKFDIT